MYDECTIMGYLPSTNERIFLNFQPTLFVEIARRCPLMSSHLIKLLFFVIVHMICHMCGIMYEASYSLVFSRRTGVAINNNFFSLSLNIY